MAITVALPSIFVKNHQRAIICRLFEARLNYSKLDRKRFLEVQKGREYVKTQG